MIRWHHLLVVLFLQVAGCVSPTAVLEETSVDGNHDLLVIALIDSGINPYHEVYRAGPDFRFPDDIGATEVDLAQEGDLAARRAVDEAFWNSVEVGRLYAFRGTRVLAISMAEDAEPIVFDGHGHGTETSSVIARDAPHAVILLIQVRADVCAAKGRLDCKTHPSTADAMEWAANQPWIDVISVSIAAHANPPEAGDLHPEAKRWVVASKKAHDSGKAVINGAGNTVIPGYMSPFAGPPWVISVGGVEFATQGSAGGAAFSPDVVANYTTTVASVESVDAMEWSSGTSFSAPAVAAVIGETLREIEIQAPDHATPVGRLALLREIKDALNASAILFEPIDWAPDNGPSNSTFRNLISPTLPVVTPGLQMGWGYVDARLVDIVVARVLAEETGIPPEKADIARVQKAQQDLREWWWSEVQPAKE